VLSRHPIKSVRDLDGADVGAPPTSRGGFALHGRYVEVDIDGLTVASVYIQTGEAGTDRQLEKERFMSALAHRMATLTDRDAVVCGDWNIAHTENDIKAFSE
jgi:exodeoxyribonuclease-3